jgi:hypothetical protein
MLQDCKILQIKRTVESGLKRGESGRMSFCDLLIGSVMHRLAPSRQSFAVDRRNCNEPSPILFTGLNSGSSRSFKLRKQAMIARAMIAGPVTIQARHLVE